MLKIIIISSMAPITLLFLNSWTTQMLILSVSTMISLIYIAPSSYESHSLLFTDPLNSPLIPLTLWISSLMILASYKILKTQNSQKSFLLTILILNLSLCMTFMSNNIMMFYIMFETTLIPTLILILSWGYQPERIQASTYLILYTVTASLPLLISIIMFTNLMNSASFYLLNWSNYILPNFKLIWWMSMSLAFLVKMPMFMTHLWLPKAHVEAPVAGSMVLAAILLKLGGYGLMRIYSLMPFMTKLTTSIIMPISLWGALITSMICIRQPDMKALIAYSSVSHMAILILGINMNSTWGQTGVMIMMIAHGLTSSLLFSLANNLYEMLNSRMLYMIKGLLSISPTMSLIWFVALAINMSAPPSINLISEILLISSFMSKFFLTMLPVSMIIFLSLLYSMNLYSNINHGYPSSLNHPLNLSSHHYIILSMLHSIPSIFLITSLINISAS